MTTTMQSPRRPTRGGPRGTWKPNNAHQRSTSNSTPAPVPVPAPPPVPESAELRALRVQYADGLQLIREIYPGWTDEDALYLLAEEQGNLEQAVTRISEGTAEKWSSATRKKEKKPAVAGPRTGNGTANGHAAAGRGGRGGRGGGRGGHQGGVGRGSPNGVTKDAEATGGEGRTNGHGPGVGGRLAPLNSAGILPFSPKKEHNWGNNVQQWARGVNQEISEAVAKGESINDELPPKEDAVEEETAPADGADGPSGWEDKPGHFKDNDLPTSLQKSFGASKGDGWDEEPAPQPKAEEPAKSSRIPMGSKISWAEIARPRPELTPAPAAPAPAASAEDQPNFSTAPTAALSSNPPLDEPEEPTTIPTEPAWQLEEPTTVADVSWEDHTEAPDNDESSWEEIPRPEEMEPVTTVEDHALHEPEPMPVVLQAPATLPTPPQPAITAPTPASTATAVASTPPGLAMRAPNKILTRPAVHPRSSSAMLKIGEDGPSISSSPWGGSKSISVQFGSLKIGDNGDDGPGSALEPAFDEDSDFPPTTAQVAPSVDVSTMPQQQQQQQHVLAPLPQVPEPAVTAPPPAPQVQAASSMSSMQHLFQQAALAQSAQSAHAAQSPYQPQQAQALPQPPQQQQQPPQAQAPSAASGTSFQQAPSQSHLQSGPLLQHLQQMQQNQQNQQIHSQQQSSATLQAQLAAHQQHLASLEAQQSPLPPQSAQQQLPQQPQQHQAHPQHQAPQQQQSQQPPQSAGPTPQSFYRNEQAPYFHAPTPPQSQPSQPDHLASYGPFAGLNQAAQTHAPSFQGGNTALNGEYGSYGGVDRPFYESYNQPGFRNQLGHEDSSKLSNQPTPSSAPSQVSIQSHSQNAPQQPHIAPGAPPQQGAQGQPSQQQQQQFPGVPVPYYYPSPYYMQNQYYGQPSPAYGQPFVKYPGMYQGPPAAGPGPHAPANKPPVPAPAAAPYASNQHAYHPSQTGSYEEQAPGGYQSATTALDYPKQLYTQGLQNFLGMPTGNANAGNGPSSILGGNAQQRSSGVGGVGPGASGMQDTYKGYAVQQQEKQQAVPAQQQQQAPQTGGRGSGPPGGQQQQGAGGYYGNRYGNAPQPGSGPGYAPPQGDQFYQYQQHRPGQYWQQQQ